MHGLLINGPATGLSPEESRFEEAAGDIWCRVAAAASQRCGRLVVVVVVMRVSRRRNRPLERLLRGYRLLHTVPLQL